MHAVCLHAPAYISAKLGQIRKIKVSMESGGHASHDYVCTLALILMFMQTIFWCTQAYILAKLGQIRKMNVSLEYGEHSRPF